MRRFDLRFLVWGVAGLAVGAAAGCGGGSGGSGVAGLPIDPAVTTRAVAAARFSVNVETGKVTVTPLGTRSNGRALYTGSAIGFEPSDLLVDAGELTRRDITVSLINHSGESTTSGINGRLIFSPISLANNYPLDLRSGSTVTTVAGTGVVGTTDGPATSAPLSNPISVASDGTTTYIVQYGGTALRKIQNGYLSTVTSSLLSPQGFSLANGSGNTLAVVANGTNQTLQVVDTRTGQIISTAGVTGTAGTGDGDAVTALFNNPVGVATAIDNQFKVYVTDSGSGRVRVVTLDYYGKITDVSTIMTGLSNPRGISVSRNGTLAVAELGTNKIRLFLPDGTPVVTLGSGGGTDVDGTGATASFNSPLGLTIDTGSTSTDVIYVSSYNGNKIRFAKLKQGAQPTLAASWIVGTIAGSGAAGAADGAGDVATIGNPRMIGLDSNNNILVPQNNNQVLRRVNPNIGVTLVGVPDTNTGTELPRLANASGYIPGATTTSPYINFGGFETQKWSFVVPAGVKAFSFTVSAEVDASSTTPLDGVLNTGTPKGSPNVFVRTVAGTGQVGYAGGSASTAQIGEAFSMTEDVSGNIFFFDRANYCIRRVANHGTVSLVAGLPGAVITSVGSSEGNGTQVRFPAGVNIAVNPDGSELAIATSLGTVQIAVLAPSSDPTLPANWSIKTVAGTYGTSGSVNGLGSIATFSNGTNGICLKANGDIYLADKNAGLIRQVSLVGDGIQTKDAYLVSTLSGTTPGFSDGAVGTAQFSAPSAVAISEEGFLLVADTGNNRIRKIDLRTNQVSTLAGSGVAGFLDGDNGLTATLTAPVGVAINSAGYAFTRNGSVLRRISPSGSVRTVAGGGASSADAFGDQASLTGQSDGLFVDSTGDLYFGDGPRIRKVERVLRGGAVSGSAGGTAGSTGGTGGGF